MIFMPSSDPIKIFIIEDDPAYQKFLKYIIGMNPDHEISVFSDGRSVIGQLHEKPSIITLDYTLPDVSGEELLKSIKENNEDTHVIIISGQENIGTAVNLLKLGAYDYISKDEETKERLVNSINNAKKNILLIKEINLLKKEISEKYNFNKSIIGSSGAMKEIFGLMQKAVKANITVSIYGETGTGKELVAKSIHYNSSRNNKPFVPINVAAIPRDLIESELFGHEKGAFTGAITRRIGKFEEADKGTLFIDEIAEMDISLQAKLLRVIQERELTRIGGNARIPLDVRIIIATHKDLADEVKSGRFREDLYYRLLGLPILLPPLRQRGSDILILAKYFLENFCRENKFPKKILTKDAQEKLMKYSYPGNVRELRSIIELASIMSNDDQVTQNEINFTRIENEDYSRPEECTLREYTFILIKNLLKKYDQDVLLVAKKLDIGKSTIYRYLKEMKE
jgi:DNA-binding NtrC family response regulator